jgi:hypothetical protein
MPSVKIQAQDGHFPMESEQIGDSARRRQLHALLEGQHPSVLGYLWDAEVPVLGRTGSSETFVRHLLQQFCASKTMRLRQGSEDYVSRKGTYTAQATQVLKEEAPTGPGDERQ